MSTLAESRQGLAARRRHRPPHLPAFSGSGRVLQALLANCGHFALCKTPKTSVSARIPPGAPIGARIEWSPSAGHPAGMRHAEVRGAAVRRLVGLVLVMQVCACGTDDAESATADDATALDAGQDSGRENPADAAEPTADDAAGAGDAAGPMDSSGCAADAVADDGDGLVADGHTGCAKDTDCPASNSPCLAPVCGADGVCVEQPTAGSVSCSDGDVCSDCAFPFTGRASQSQRHTTRTDAVRSSLCGESPRRSGSTRGH